MTSAGSLARFGSAPSPTRSLARSKWPFIVAMRSGLVSLPSATRSMSAPASSNARTEAVWPCRAAKRSALIPPCLPTRSPYGSRRRRGGAFSSPPPGIIQPKRFAKKLFLDFCSSSACATSSPAALARALRKSSIRLLKPSRMALLSVGTSMTSVTRLASAPRSMRTSITLCRPLAAANMRAVWPPLDSRALTSGSRSRRSRAASTLPEAEANMSAVAPVVVASFASAPAARSVSIIDAFPCLLAKRRGV